MKFTIKVVLFFLIFLRISFCSSENWKFSTPLQEFEIDFVPKVIEGNFYIPIKELLNKFNAETIWYDKEKTLEIYIFSKKVKLQIGSKKVIIDGEEKMLPSQPFILEKQVFIPIRAFSEILNFKYQVEMKEKYIKFFGIINKIEVNKDKILQFKITGTLPSKYKIENLQFPDRIVIDIPDNILEMEQKIYPLEEGAIKKIRISQFQVKPYIVRCVIDLDISLNCKVSSIGNEILIEFNKQLKEITYEKEDETVRVKIKGTAPLTYIPQEYRNPWRLVFDFPDCILGIKPKEIKITQGVVKGIRISQFQINPDIVRVVIDLERRSSFKLYSLEEGKELILELSALLPFLKDKIIVIDPGHGGRQNGAISPWGLKEKEINLEVAKYLSDLLFSAGCLVIMTRTEDKEVTLDERVEIANINKADIFVSIHSNALPTNPAMRGTETYYYTSLSKILAIAIQKNLVKEICLPDRRVKTAGFVVIKKTNMPSVLVEVAYLTNKEDEQLLRDSEFRKKSAQGIFNGIKEYFENEELVPVE